MTLVSMGTVHITEETGREGVVMGIGTGTWIVEGRSIAMEGEGGGSRQNGTGINTMMKTSNLS